MSKAANRFSPEVHAGAVRMALDHEGECCSRAAAVCSVAAKIGCTAQDLNKRIKKAEVDSGVHAGVPADVAGRRHPQAKHRQETEHAARDQESRHRKTPDPRLPRLRLAQITHATRPPARQSRPQGGPSRGRNRSGLSLSLYIGTRGRPQQALDGFSPDP